MSSGGYKKSASCYSVLSVFFQEARVNFFTLFPNNRAAFFLYLMFSVLSRLTDDGITLLTSSSEPVAQFVIITSLSHQLPQSLPSKLCVFFFDGVFFCSDLNCGLLCSTLPPCCFNTDAQRRPLTVGSPSEEPPVVQLTAAASGASLHQRRRFESADTTTLLPLPTRSPQRAGRRQ